MKLKLTFERPGGRPAADLLVNVDASATVGAVADYLAEADPDGGVTASGTSTLAVVGQSRSSISRSTRLAESGIVSGSTVRLAQIDTGDAPSLHQVSGVVTVFAGPDEGREYPVPAGSSIIGRDRSCEVRLSDPMVSRQHARLNLGDVAELVDLGSANGIVVGDESSEKVVLRPGDAVRLGDTMLSVRLLSQPDRAGAPSSVNFNRPPRIDRRYAGLDLVAPEPPDAPKAQRFPILPLFAPLVMGLVLYIATHSLASLIFVAMSPLLVVANAAEGRLSGRKSYREALGQFRQDIADLVEEAEQAKRDEQKRRLEEHPSTAAVCEAAGTLSPLLWSRWPDLPGFAELRLGLGTQPSRIRVELPSGKQNNRSLWKELRDAVAPLASIDGVPVVSDLAEAGAVGVGGSRQDVMGVARGLVLQAACLHSPAELVLVGLASSQSGPDWDWIKWLPHCFSGQSPLQAGPLVSSESGCAALVAEIGRLISDREADKDRRHGSRVVPVVLVIVDDDAPIVRSSVVDLARRGGAVGVHMLWVAEEVCRLPAVCKVFAEVVGPPGESTAGFVHLADEVSPLMVETVTAATAEQTARKLSSVVDVAAGDDSQSDLPRSVSLLSLVGRGLASTAEAVVERWNESRSILSGPMAPPPILGRRRPGTLRAIVGETVSGPHTLDLRAQGPHALVGGTTGSGKSELLQSWILGMALSNSPQRVTFLLVDYKGGSAFSDCMHLPHTVGLVTDLSPHLVRRALTSLSAELKYREDLLHRKKTKDLLELERSGDPETPPSLVIVVDEFAALVQEVPDFVDGVVNVAQRGRSLGLHLILATQRPAGVIKDNLRANTNLRLALRMADEADSTDVLGTPDAASFDPSIPGRAVSRTGPSQLVPFQAAYAGGWTTDKPAAPAIEVASFGFAPRVVWEKPADDEEIADPGATDIQRLVSNLRAAHLVAEIPDPRLPWLPELAPLYDLARLPTRRRDDELVFAVADDPERQSQPVVSFRPDEDGNLAVYGTGNSGKSTLLRSLAVAAGFTVRGGPCRVYCLDFGARGLAMLEALPHVGSVVPGGDDERVARLLGMLRAEIDERAARYSKVRAGTVTAYRELADAPDEPRILLMVDGMGAFRSAYEGTEHTRLFDAFLGIAADGRPVGIHVVITADRPGAVPVALAASIQRRVALRLADPNDYSTMGMPADILDSDSPPGRGIFGDQEIQVAVLGKSPDPSVQALEIAKFAKAMANAGAEPAPTVGRLTDRVALADLPKEIAGAPVLGISGVTLAPVSFEARGTFSVAGPPGSGRTTVLTSVISALKRWRPELALIYIGNRRSPLAGAFEWERRAVDPSEAATLAAEIPGLVGEAIDDMTPWVVVVEGLPDFLNGPADLPLGEMAKSVISGGHLLVTEGEASALSGSYPVLVSARSGRSGIVLQPEPSDSVLFRAQFPRLRRADFPPGRGLFVPRGGVPTVVQVGLP